MPLVNLYNFLNKAVIEGLISGQQSAAYAAANRRSSGTATEISLEIH